MFDRGIAYVKKKKRKERLLFDVAICQILKLNQA